VPDALCSLNSQKELRDVRKERRRQEQQTTGEWATRANKFTQDVSLHESNLAEE